MLAQAQQEVLVGVGVLAGSTILLLTVGWAGSLVVGRCDLSGPGETAKDLTLTRGFDLFRTGITTDEQTRCRIYNANNVVHGIHNRCVICLMTGGEH